MTEIKNPKLQNLSITQKYIMLIAIPYSLKNLRQEVKKNGGIWNPMRKCWQITASIDELMCIKADNQELTNFIYKALTDKNQLDYIL